MVDEGEFWEHGGVGSVGSVGGVGGVEATVCVYTSPFEMMRRSLPHPTSPWKGEEPTYR